MLFNSFEFIFLFLPAVLFISFLLKGNRLLGWIALSSAVFYALFGAWWFLVPMLITTTLDYALAIWLAKTLSPVLRRVILGLSLGANLGLLAYFKYGGMFSATFLQSPLGSVFPMFDTFLFHGVMPAGISFYTFQTVSYMVDVFRGEAKPERNFLKFAGFVSFFPHLVAGPLTRHHQLLPSLDAVAHTGVIPRWKGGVFLFSIGLCKKVLLGDYLATHVVDPLLYGTDALGFSQAWLACIGFSFQIYFDFSGYTDMAIGVGRLFGIELPQNFNAPYRAVSPADFWRRWHITLSLWIRDYLYIPLGGNQVHHTRRVINLLITMFLAGLWHGAQWKFAIWGVYHGLLLGLYAVGKDYWDGCPELVRRMSTFLLISAGWVFFRGDHLGRSFEWAYALIHPLAPGGVPLHLEIALWLFLVASSALLIHVIREWSLPESLERTGRLGQALLGIGTAISILRLSTSSRFIYFEF